MLTLSLICLFAQVTVSLRLDFIMTFNIAFLSDNGNHKNYSTMSNLLSVFSNLNLTRTLGGRYYCSHFTDKENEASEAEYLHKLSRESNSDLNQVSLVAQTIKNPSVMQETGFDH